MAKKNLRRSYKRDVLRKRVAAKGLPCAICGQPIDYSLTTYLDPTDGKIKPHPMRFELDEIVPISRLPEDQRKAAACDPNNVQPVHRICNLRKSNSMPEDARAMQLPIKHSRQW